MNLVAGGKEGTVLRPREVEQRFPYVARDVYTIAGAEGLRLKQTMSWMKEVMGVNTFVSHLQYCGHLYLEQMGSGNYLRKRFSPELTLQLAKWVASGESEMRINNRGREVIDEEALLIQLLEEPNKNQLDAMRAAYPGTARAYIPKRVRVSLEEGGTKAVVKAVGSTAAPVKIHDVISPAEALLSLAKDAGVETVWHKDDPFTLDVPAMIVAMHLVQKQAGKISKAHS